MELPEDERAELAAVLVDSIGDGRPEADIDEAWLRAIRQRLQAVRAGQATLIPTEEVERELEEVQSWMLIEGTRSRGSGI